MNYYVFQVSDQSKYGKQRTGQEIFDFLVKGKSVWGFGYNTPNRKAIQPGDKILFYLTGAKNQMFIGSAILKSGVYNDRSSESKEWFLDPETMRIDLEDVVIFDEPKPRKSFKSIEWRPAQGGSSKISERDFMVIRGISADVFIKDSEPEHEMEFALEKYLEDFIVSNWEKINFFDGLQIFEDKDGNFGQQYYTEDVGYIDILATDKDGNFVVIELKKGRKNDEVVGQVLRYIGWVRKNLCTSKQSVKGIIIVGEKDEKLEYAVREISDKVSVKLYKISFKLDDYN